MSQIDNASAAAIASFPEAAHEYVIDMDKAVALAVEGLARISEELASGEERYAAAMAEIAADKSAQRSESYRQILERCERSRLNNLIQDREEEVRCTYDLLRQAGEGDACASGALQALYYVSPGDAHRAMCLARREGFAQISYRLMLSAESGLFIQGVGALRSYEGDDEA